MFYRKYLKRLFDFSLAVVLIVLTSPLILAVSFLLYISNKGKVFFVQPRPGKNEKIFKVYKFRTMADKRDMSGDLLPDIRRITGLGIFLRKSSLDELPQLFNILKGDMSLVGPRPLLPDYLPLYSEFQRKRHKIRPGITGWAQVNGRNAISWTQKFELDSYYVEHLSFIFDIKIMMLTLKRVFCSEGINSSSDATMSTFTGNTNDKQS